MAITHGFRKGLANPSLPRRQEIAAQAMRKGGTGLPLGAHLHKYEGDVALVGLVGGDR